MKYKTLGNPCLSPSAGSLWQNWSLHRTAIANSSGGSKESYRLWAISSRRSNHPKHGNLIGDFARHPRAGLGGGGARPLVACCCVCYPPFSCHRWTGDCCDYTLGIGFIGGARQNPSLRHGRGFGSILIEDVNVRPITPEIAALATQFPPEFSGDPADRLIAATARAEGLTLLTRDQNIRR